MTPRTRNPNRSTTTRDRHRRRQPPRRCAQCGTTGTPLKQDHILNLAAGGKDTIANMQWLCNPCHNIKTEAEITVGKRAFHAKRTRQPEPHPGRLT